jgi:hypothetical protein
MVHGQDATSSLDDRVYISLESQQNLSTSSLGLQVCHPCDSRQTSPPPAAMKNLATSHTIPPGKRSEESTKAKATRKQPHGRERAFWYITTHTAACLAVVGLYSALVFGTVEILNGWYQEPFDLTYAFCDAGGNYHFESTPSFWAPSQAFQISLAFGSMSFSTAKIVDVVWDVVRALL